MGETGVAYSNQGAVAKAIGDLKKAYDVRERVTERERMYIEAQYALQQFDLPKSLEAYKLYASTYPRDAAALNNLASVYSTIGDLDQRPRDSKKPGRKPSGTTSPLLILPEPCYSWIE